MPFKPQIFIVHGGMTFKTRRDYVLFLKTRSVSLDKKNSWSGEWLDKKLAATHEIIRPRMPLQDNAKYEDWKIYFERFIPLLRPGAIFIGSSLGGIFLAKYFSEHALAKKAAAIVLVCPPFDNTLGGEDLVGGFRLQANLSLLQKNTKHLHLFFSADDTVVPVAHAEKYQAKLPQAEITVLTNKNGHFAVSEFPELVTVIRGLT